MGINKVIRMSKTTALQSGMLFYSILNEDSANYHEQICLSLTGRVDVAYLQSAWQEVVNRFEVFRTDFRWKESKNPVQIVVEEKEAEVFFRDITTLSESEKEVYISALKADEQKLKFNFEEGRLSRLVLVKVDEEKYFLCWSFHHILLDGWSVQIVLRSLLQIYDCLLTGKVLPDKPTIQFGEYLKWLDKQNKRAAEQYWQEYMQKFSEPTFLPSGKKLVKEEVITECGVYEIQLAKDKSTQIEEFCKNNRITVNALIETAWGILLQKYSNTNQSCFGMTISIRPAEIEGIEEAVGLFINTLPVVICTEKAQTVGEILHSVNQNLLESRDYGYVSLVDIEKMVQPTGGDKLFNTIVAFENYPVDEAVKGAVGFDISLDSVYELTNYDLTMAVMAEENLLFKLLYNVDLFSTEAIEGLGRSLETLIGQMIENPDQKVVHLDTVTAGEKRRLLVDFNETKTNYPRMKTLHQLFEEQVAVQPEQAAVIFEDTQLTYQELNDRANQLAVVLRAKGVKPEIAVGIMVERSPEMIIGILGVLKAGGFYVPIDPEYPEKRIRYMLEDSSAKLLLTQSYLKERITFQQEVIELDDPCLYTGSGANPGYSSEAENLAYIIYTSGTTGKPKGTMITHHNVSRVVKETNYINITPQDRILQLSNYAFDGSIFDIFGALLNGAGLVLLRKEYTLDLEKLTKVIEDAQITVFFVTTALFNTIVDTNLDCFRTVRKILFGGERVSVPHVRKAFTYLGPGRLLHVYGPTESTVYSTYYSIDQVEVKIETIPIGKPLANTQIYIVDQFNNLKAVGMPGEICIAGDGLARGYLNQPEMTEEKFVSNPFVPGEKMYRSGDLGRWLPDGNIEFLDRIDQQVKIRGFRIELGEIENQILSYPGIKEVLVLDRVDNTGVKYLCAYVVAKAELSPQDLKRYLTKELPEYMVPAYIITLDKMPLNLNGKIDKQLLPQPEIGRTGSAYAAPTNAVEERLAAIWAEVLGVEKVGITDNFFDLGGHSLKATSLVARVKKEFHVELPLRRVFQTPTVQELAEYISSASESVYSGIPGVEERSYYPVSSAQKRLLVLNQLEGSSTSYNLPVVMTIEGELLQDKFEQAFTTLIRRHESLRTSFELVDGEPVQIIHPEVEFQVVYRNLEGGNIEQVISEFIQPFDLSKAPLLRAELINTGDKHLFMFDMHHIISDGISMKNIVTEFVQLYQGQDLPELRIQYKDFAVWQNSQFTTEKFRKQESHWLNVFAGELPILDLPTDYQRPVVANFVGSRVEFTIDTELAAGLKEIGTQTGSTLFMVLLAAYNIFLAKYTGQEDIIVGSPIAGRHHTDLENIVGMFVNTIALRNYPESDKTFVQFLYEVKQNALQAFENQDYQFEMLVEKLNLQRDMSRNPLFDTMFSLQNISNSAISVGKIQFIPHKFENPTAKFDLELIAAETENGISFTLEYSTQLFRRETIEQMCRQFVNLLEHVHQTRYIKLSDIQIIDEQDRQTLIYGLNSLQAEFSRNRSIYHLFEDSVRTIPEKPAVKYGEDEVSYQELNRRVNQLAHYLRNIGICDDQLVGILLERSPLMIECILAAWKAGAGYIPIDPAYPVERISGILQDSGAKVLLSKSDYLPAELVTQFPGVVVDLAIDTQQVAKESSENLNLELKMDNLAYVIYTSGSTGKPKGAMVEHVGMMNHLQAKINDLQLTSDCIVAQNASHCFDISVWQFFVALAVGGKTVIYPNELTLEPEKFIEQVIKDQVTTLEVVPSFLSIMLDALEIRLQKFAQLRHILVTGEAVKPKLVQRWFALYPGIRMINAYGPTEASDDITHFIMDEAPERVSIPIGKPIHNFHIYIVDNRMQLCPRGVKGEICVSGVGVGRGYLNNEEKTRQAFMEDPFVPEKGRRLYKTGDIGRWLPDGTIEFFGRKDFQVKIRGFRIELGEIESQLVSYSNVREAVVIDREDKAGNKYLCAYVVSNSDLNIAELRNHLSQKLPEYMVPGHFINLKAIPLNPNGKIDRKALPEPDQSSEAVSAEYVAPANEIEARLAQVWAEVLGLSKVGVKENFFVLGGDSIKAIQIAARLQKYQLKLEIKDLFQHPIISDLAPYITQLKRQSDQGLITGEIELTPIQREFFQQEYVESHHYNQAVLLLRKTGFDAAIVERVWGKILEHHDALRMTFTRVNEGIVQTNRTMVENLFTLQIFDLSKTAEYQDEIQIHANAIQAAMNIFGGPLVKLGLFKTPDGDQLLIAIHHLVIDGISWRIILEDFAIGYRQAEESRQIEFQAKTDSYREWAGALLEYASSEDLHAEISYWHKVENTDVPTLPKDKFSGKNLRRDRKAVDVELTARETEHLLKSVNKAYNTEINDILLTAFALAVKQWAQIEKVAIILEGHGREERIKDIDITRTVGWFTSLYPVILDVTQTEDISYLLKTTKEDLRRIPNKGFGYGVLKYLAPGGVDKAGAFKLKPEIVFNYLGQLDENLGEDLPFSMSELSPGVLISPNAESKYTLEVNGFVRAERLSLEISYSQNHYEDTSIQKLAQLYKANLQALIEHCVSKKEAEFTPSDYGYSDLSLGGLDKISKKVAQLKKNRPSKSGENK